MKNKQILFGLILLIALSIGCTGKSGKIENIQSFARIYGYVRWFYPGDEASAVNWNKFAVNGINKVENARNPEELRSILLQLFKPIAPAIQITDSSLATNFSLQSITPNNLTGFKPVSWVHYGVYLGEQSNIYQSIRMNRIESDSKHFSLLTYITDISKYWNKEVKVIVTMKTSRGAMGDVSLYLTSTKSLGPDIFQILKKKMHTVTPTDKWNEFEFSITINQSDSYVLFGMDLNALDHLYISDIKLLERENKTWTPIKSFKPDFNNSNWEINNFLYSFKTDSIQKRDGGNAVEITTAVQTAKIGDFVRKNIGNHLVCTMPLALYGTAAYTYPVPDSLSLKKLNEQMANIPDSALNTRHLNVRLANVVIMWNTLQHFYPYFDVVHVDWKKELSNSLKEVYKGRNEPDYYKALSRMVAKLQDGHGVVYNGKSIVQWGLPVSFAWIENVVIISGSKSPLFKRGDIIKTIDGRNALEELLTQESLVSGSPQLKRYRALNIFGSDFSQSEANITLLRDGKTLDIKAKRGERCNLFFNLTGMSNLKSKEYSDGIYYENSRETDFDKELSYLVSAKGIIVDPLSEISKLIPHIIKEPVWSPTWYVPVTTYPDRENVKFSTSRWKINPVQPYINAKLAFIEEPFNVSSGETFLSFIDHYKLGKLVGDTTAGTNGNVNFIPLMGGYSIMWTGMKVLKHDGSQHHLIGFRPDYPVNRTIQAIKDSRNEYLEKALEVLKSQQ